MKVTYITTCFPFPSETFACNDVLTLKRLGIDVSTYALKAPHPNAKQMVAERGLSDIPIASCGPKETLLGFALAILNPLLLISLLYWLVRNDFDKPRHLIKCILLTPPSFYLLRLLKKQRPDVVHLFWGHYPAVVGYLVKRQLPMTKLSLFLGAYDLEMKLGISSSIAEVSDCIFTHSSANLTLLKGLGIDENSVTVVHRGVDLGLLEASNKGVLKESLTILSAGRLVPFKGFEKVISIFGDLLPKHPKMRLTIAGDGPSRQCLEMLSVKLGLKEGLKFSGHLPQADLIKQMANAEFFILLSNRERLPNVVKEAMFSKCICITSHTPGINELITHGVNGFIFDPNDLDDIVDLVNNLTESKKTEIGIEAKKFIVDNFSCEVSMKKYLDVWTLPRSNH